MWNVSLHFVEGQVISFVSAPPLQFNDLITVAEKCSGLAVLLNWIILQQNFN